MEKEQEQWEGLGENVEEWEEATGDGDKGEGSTGGGGGMTPKEMFLAAHKLGISVANSARVAGVSRRTIYRWRDKDPEFAKGWREAREGLVEDLEMEAYKRAFKGNDRLLMFLLKSYKPTTYNERLQRRQGKAGLADKALKAVEFLEKVKEWA